LAWQAVGMSLPSLYKARGVPLKRPVCAICVERTRGLTTVVKLPYGVTVSLCQGHAGAEFLTKRGGRDFVVTMMRVWQANGCLTAARHKALGAHLAALAGPPPRQRPGSYAWPAVRTSAERLFAAGVSPDVVARRIRRGGFGLARPPSVRTIARWHGDRRWLGTGAAASVPP
jgi:hypothetical protein